MIDRNFAAVARVRTADSSGLTVPTRSAPVA
jgi:hypothetical protein